jgi:hypothetical protein
MDNLRLRIEVLDFAVDWDDLGVTSGPLGRVRRLATTPAAGRLRLPVRA